LNF
jgi:hypothetical protein